MKEKKLNFGERIKIAIFKLEDYEKFTEEKTSISIKYFFLLIFIVSFLLTIISSINISNGLNKAIKYVKNELPEFKYEDGKLHFENFIEAYDNEYDVYLIANTDENVADEQINEYKNKILNVGMIFLNDKAIYVNGTNNVEYLYSDLSNEYGVNTLNKHELITKIDAIGSNGITMVLAMTFFIFEYIVETISIFADWIIIAIFAWCVSKICKINLNFKQNFNISIYALTLSIILGVVYNFANYFWGFYTEYFRSIYLLIAYIYVIAVILMMKSDAIKEHEEIIQIKKEQEKIHKELEEKNDLKEKQKEEPKEDSNENKKEKDDENNEPDGSEI